MEVHDDRLEVVADRLMETEANLQQALTYLREIADSLTRLSRPTGQGNLPLVLCASLTAMHCRYCAKELRYVHGHGACLNNQCPMYGLNQAECCDGEMACRGAPSTSTVASVPRSLQPHKQ